MDCTTGTPFSLTSGPADIEPTFILSCTSMGGPIRKFDCISDGNNVAGVPSLRTPVDQTVRDQGLYDHIATVTGNYAGDYTCQVTVYRYDGIAPEPEMLVYLADQIITVPGELVNISLSVTYLSHADHYPSLSQLLTLPLDCQPHTSVPPSESAGLHPHPPPMATGYTIKQRVTRDLLSLWSSQVAVQTQGT